MSVVRLIVIDLVWIDDLKATIVQPGGKSICKFKVSTESVRSVCEIVIVEPMLYTTCNFIVIEAFKRF